MQVLIVDDETMLLELVGNIIEELGCTVFKATNGRDGLEIVQTHPIHLILTDVHMPVMSGVELIIRARSLGYSKPIIVMDSYPESFMECQVAHEIQAVVAKPFDLTMIRNLVQTHLFLMEEQENVERMAA